MTRKPERIAFGDRVVAAGHTEPEGLVVDCGAEGCHLVCVAWKYRHYVDERWVAKMTLRRVPSREDSK